MGIMGCLIYIKFTCHLCKVNSSNKITSSWNMYRCVNKRSPPFHDPPTPPKKKNLQRKKQHPSAPRPGRKKKKGLLRELELSDCLNLRLSPFFLEGICGIFMQFYNERKSTFFLWMEVPPRSSLLCPLWRNGWLSGLINHKKNYSSGIPKLHTL